MRPHASTIRVALAVFLLAPVGRAQDPPKPESNYVKLLKRAPDARKGPIVDIIGKRGDAADLAYLFDHGLIAVEAPAALRVKALAALDEAASTRDVRPEGDLAPLGRLIRTAQPGTDREVRLGAIRLAGTWKLAPALPDLAAAAAATGSEVDGAVLAAALGAMAAIGGDAARLAIVGLAGPSQPPSTRALAVASLARIDLPAAADRATAILTDDARIEDVTPVIAAFLDRRDGADALAAALARHRASADGARLGLRAVYALGRADESLVAAFSKSAGIEAEARPLDKPELDRFVAEVGTRGDAARGEAVFRRAEMNCMNCHALSGAAGGVGPELSSLGLSSPVDYVIYSLLLPDQSIKEEYQTRVVLTDDGRVSQGIVVDEDEKRIVLRDASGERRVIPTSTIEDSRRGGSLMPKGLPNLLTRAEFLDLVRFLSELGKPGPYALRSTSTIQRWRALKTVPEVLATATMAPSGDEFRTAILEAEPAAWSPLYAWTGGALPASEVAAATGGPVAYLQGEIAVSGAGPAALRFDSAAGLTAWVDDRPVPPGESPTIDLPEGKRKLTIRVDLRAREGRAIRVEVAKPPGSRAEFAVVGGR